MLIRWNEKWRWAQDFLLLLSPHRIESFTMALQQARWHNLLCLENLLLIKSVVVGFCFTGGWWYSELWEWDLMTQFQGCEMSRGLYQDHIDGYVKPCYVTHSVVVMSVTLNPMCSQLSIYNFVWKTNEGEGEIILSVCVLWQCLNHRWMRGGGVRQKVLLRVSWNHIFFQPRSEPKQ